MTSINDMVAGAQSDHPMTDALERPDYTNFESHFSTNLNLDWQKLDAYYRNNDAMSIYRSAVVLHPRMKWRWFNKHWGIHHPIWVVEVQAAVRDLWGQYKATTPPTTASVDSDDSDDSDDDVDQYDEYCAEPRASTSRMTRHESPIPYWISKLDVWPQLAWMALDIHTTPACSDEPERMFSVAGNTLNPRRRLMTADTTQELLCLRSCQKSGIIQLNNTMFEQAVQAGENAPMN
jgi:hypothetical protein